MGKNREQFGEHELSANARAAYEALSTTDGSLTGYEWLTKMNETQGKNLGAVSIIALANELREAGLVNFEQAEKEGQSTRFSAKEAKEE